MKNRFNQCKLEKLEQEIDDLGDKVKALVLRNGFSLKLKERACSELDFKREIKQQEKNNANNL